MDAEHFTQNCTDLNGKLARFPLMDKTQDVGSNVPSASKSMKFVPRELSLRRDTKYVFKVQVLANDNSLQCYSTIRQAAATVSVEIAAAGQDRLLPLEIAVCSKYPCSCSEDEDERDRFNAGSKVILRACSTEAMKRHKWRATSAASLAAASFTSPTGDGRRKQPVVTVIMNSAISENALEP